MYVLHLHRRRIPRPVGVFGEIIWRHSDQFLAELSHLTSRMSCIGNSSFMQILSIISSAMYSFFTILARVFLEMPAFSAICVLESPRSISFFHNGPYEIISSRRLSFRKTRVLYITDVAVVKHNVDEVGCFNTSPYPQRQPSDVLHTDSFRMPSHSPSVCIYQ